MQKLVASLAYSAVDIITIAVQHSSSLLSTVDIKIKLA